jgi:hypothetical protein
MFNLNSKAEKIFCMKPVQMKPVLAEEVAAVKNNPHQHRSKQPIDKTANEAHLQRTDGLLLEPLQS